MGVGTVYGAGVNPLLFLSAILIQQLIFLSGNHKRCQALFVRLSSSKELTGSKKAGRFFLIAKKRLYKRVCTWVRPFVRYTLLMLSLFGLLRATYGRVSGLV